MLIENKNHIVSEFKIGETTIKICDDYCKNKSKSDVENILKRISENIDVDCLAK